MDMPWEDVQLFLAVAETKSFSAAARQLKLGQPTVSRRVAELEDALGFRLFTRHAGGAGLTAEAEPLLEPARKMAEWAGEVGRALARDRHAPEGLVRIAAPPGVTDDFVVAFAAGLQAESPGLRIASLSSVEYLDLARGEADLALRSRAPASKDLVVVTTVKQENALFVSRAYAKTLPSNVGLEQLRWIAWSPPYDALTPNPELRQLVPGFKPAFTADSFIVMMRAAEEGLGALALPRLRHRRMRATGLVPLSIDLGPFAQTEMHVVCARSALAIPRVRRVADALVQELARCVPR